MNKKTTIIVGIASIFILSFIVIAVTYAFYYTNFKGNGSATSISVTIGSKAKVAYTDYSVSNISAIIAPGYKHVKNFEIRNTGEMRANYSIYLMEVDNDFIRNEDVTYVLYRTNNRDLINENDLSKWDIVSSGTYPKTDSLLVSNEVLENPNDFYYYAFKVNYNSIDGVEQNIDMGHTFSGKIQISGSPYELNSFESSTLAYNILNNALNATNGTIYKNSFRTVPGKEVSLNDEAILTTAKDDFSTSYYFRGNVENNYVEVNNVCFRIVRIQGDGTIKLALANDGVCADASSDTAFIGSNLFDSKEAIKTWYESKNFTNTAETYWCNGTNSFDTDLENTSPSLVCNGERFVDKVSYLTVDEVALAGSIYGDSNNNNYLTENTDSSWWTSSLNSSSNMSYIVNGKNGIAIGGLDTNNYIRPAIILKRNVNYLSGDGTKTNPYRVN